MLIFGIWIGAHPPELDRGGPARRVAPEVPGACADFLYISYTNATAFSPTDTVPLTPLAKLLIALQSSIALITILLVVARAVNVLGP
jgi:hypothetical protein